MKDLADHLGVSRQLVSLALRGLPGASDDTRRRVREAAAELGYHPDASARLLRGNRSYQIGVVFTMRQPFEVDLVEALLTAAAGAGFTLVLGPLTEARPHAAVIDELLGHRIEALLVLAADGGVAAIDSLPRRIPVVQVGGPQGDGAADDVRLDDEQGMALMVEHLVGLGHRSITHVSGGSGPNADARRATYLREMKRHGLDEHADVIESEYTEEAGSRAALDLLGRQELPTAVIAGNDRAAVGVLETLVRHDVDVPGHVSVAGFDDSTVAGLPYIELTTIGHDPSGLAARAIDAVVRRLATPDAAPLRHRELPHLVIRRSTGAPRLR